MTPSASTSSTGKCHQIADDCLQRAITARSVELADQWLRIAGTWLAMEKFKQRLSTHTADIAMLCDAGLPGSKLPDQNKPV